MYALLMDRKDADALNAMTLYMWACVLGVCMLLGPNAAIVGDTLERQGDRCIADVCM